MAYSIQTAVGPVTSLTLTILYSSASAELNVYLNGVLQTYGATYTVSYQTLTFTPAVATGVKIVVVRRSQISSMKNIFSTNAQFRPAQIDDALKQLLWLCQEAREGSDLRQLYTNLDMQGFQLQTLGPATTAGNAVEYSQYATSLTGMVAQVNAATAQANAAAASAAAAAASASVAVSPWDGHRLRFTDATFPANFKQQQRSFLRADIVAPNGEGTNGIQAISINGTPSNNTIINFLATATPDVVTMSGWALRGAGGTNPLVVSNFGAWFENNTHIVWAQEIDVNNEGATQSEGNHNGGVGVAINTGSTYSPNSAIDIRRYTGAGSGPGFLQGIVIAGVRNTAIRVEAMAAATYPGMSPAAPGSIDVIQALVSNDTNARFRGSIGNANSGMRMEWGSGSAATDIFMERVGAGMLTVNSDINSNVNAAYFGVWSAVSANNTPVGKVEFAGKNSAAAVKAYSTLISTITNNTAGAEAGMFQIWNRVAGTVTHVLDVQAGLIVGSTAGGGDMGIGTVNVLNAYHTNGIKVVGARDTGWGAASNGSKVAFNGSTATLAQTSAAVAAIISALTTHGLLGA